MSERKDKRDILVILRDPGYIGQQAIFAEAAAEIERLRAALEAVDSEIVLDGQLKELVDEALGTTGEQGGQG